VTDDEFWSLCDVRLPTADDPDPCFVFVGGSTGKDGRYGCVDRDTAHRRAWRMCVGDIPEGYWVGACVKNVRCVNPAHLRCDTPTNVLLANPNWRAGRSRKESRTEKAVS
jgi:hypothetical protein